MVGLMAVILIVIMMNKRTKFVINKFPNLCFRKNHQYKSAFIPRWDAERKFTEAEVCLISQLIITISIFLVFDTFLFFLS